VIVLIRPDADAVTVEALVRAIRELGLEAVHLDETKGRAIEVVGSERGAALALRDQPAVAEILTRRARLVGGDPIWPHFTLRLAILLVYLVTVLVVLTAFAAPGLGDLAEPTADSGTGAPEWYLRPLGAFLGLFPDGLRWLGGTLVLLFWVLLFAWPFLDRSDPETPRGRRILRLARCMGVGLILLVILLGLVPL
jgi:quinol-cytochrome oxidoreductase complex cytochrome b subunit